MKVKLYEKKIKNGKRSLYLDFYPPVMSDGKQTRREFLKLYVFEKPKTELERAHNKDTRLQGETVRSERQLDLQAKPHGFVSPRRRNADFLQFLRQKVERKQKQSEATLRIWKAILHHFENFCGGRCTFAHLDAPFIEQFRDYLLTREPHQIRTGEPDSETRGTAKRKTISPNTAKSYFERFISVIKQASEENYLSSDPTAKIEPIKGTTPRRDFLLYDELRTLAQTVCDIPDSFRRAALFSALTGLRHSDIVNLNWNNVRRSAATGAILDFRIVKTGEQIMLPISDEAFELLGESRKQNEPIFESFKYSKKTSEYVEKWTKAAGIERRITFHAFRRTYATTQRTLGTDVETIQEMLGHSDPRQTRIYAHLVDEKKREAANKITLK